MTMFFWAINFHAAKIALEYYSPMAVAGFRFFFGTLVLFGVLFFQQKSFKLSFSFSTKDWWFIFLVAFFGFYLTIYFFNKGLTTTSAVNSSLIISTSTIITAIFAFFLMGKKLTIVQWFSILFSFFGVAVILVKGDFAQLLKLEIAAGDFYILMMALVFSFSQVIVDKYLKNVDAIAMTTFATLIALILFVVSSFTELTSTALPSALPFWGSILFMGVLGTGLAYAAFYYGLVRLGATKTTLFMNLIPFFTVLTAYPFGETVYLIQMVGGSIIIVGLLLFGWAKAKKVEAVEV